MHNARQVNQRQVRHVGRLERNVNDTGRDHAVRTEGRLVLADARAQGRQVLDLFHFRGITRLWMTKERGRPRVALAHTDANRAFGHRACTPWERNARDEFEYAALACRLVARHRNLGNGTVTFDAQPTQRVNEGNEPLVLGRGGAEQGGGGDCGHRVSCVCVDLQ